MGRMLPITYHNRISAISPLKRPFSHQRFDRQFMPEAVFTWP
jgi:hypothetical protein